MDLIIYRGSEVPSSAGIPQKRPPVRGLFHDDGSSSWGRRHPGSQWAEIAPASDIEGENAEPAAAHNETTAIEIDKVDPRIPIYNGMLPLTITDRGSCYLAENFATTGARITRCTANDNSVHGIVADDGSMVRSCVANDNGENGIWLDAGIVSRCVVDNNDKNGIRVDGDSTILDNHIGIDLDGSYNVIARNVMADNIVFDLEVDRLAMFNQVHLFGITTPSPVPPWANLQHSARDISPDTTGAVRK